MNQSMHECYSLLAASSNGQVWGRFDHQPPAYDNGELLTILTLAVLFITVILLLIRVRSIFQTDSKRGLFSELCHAHGLKASSRRLLTRLAAARRLKNPSLLFVEPAHFESSNLPHAMQHAADELQLLRDQIFG
jgi:hypothetical protein